jgi:hypothetical protein
MFTFLCSFKGEKIPIITVLFPLIIVQLIGLELLLKFYI